MKYNYIINHIKVALKLKHIWEYLENQKEWDICKYNNNNVKIKDDQSLNANFKENDKLEFQIIGLQNVPKEPEEGKEESASPDISKTPPPQPKIKPRGEIKRRVTVTPDGSGAQPPGNQPRPRPISTPGAGGDISKQGEPPKPQPPKPQPPKPIQRQYNYPKNGIFFFTFGFYFF